MGHVTYNRSKMPLIASREKGRRGRGKRGEGRMGGGGVKGPTRDPRDRQSSSPQRQSATSCRGEPAEPVEAESANSPEQRNAGVHTRQ